MLGNDIFDFKTLAIGSEHALGMVVATVMWTSRMFRNNSPIWLRMLYI
jgi:hypothetical protein